MDRINSIMNATPDKRYKNFISHCADYEEVWLLDGGEGYRTYDKDGKICILIWQEKEMANRLASDNDTAIMLEVHGFCKLCEENLDNELLFMVCPNEKDAYITSVLEVYEDLQEELSFLE